MLALLGLADVNPRRIKVAIPKRARPKLPAFIEPTQVAGDPRTTLYEGLPAQPVADAILECRGRVETERLVEAARQARADGLLTTAVAAGPEGASVVSYSEPPVSVRSLEQRIRNLEGDDGLALRRRLGMALVVVGQMLPEGAVKGGSAMALRYGRGTRFSRDLDAARVQSLVRFRSDFEESLGAGCAGFTGRLIEKAAPRPSDVPTAYVMQPFDVRLEYRGRSWCSIAFELGHNELGDADEPDYQLAPDLARLFIHKLQVTIVVRCAIASRR